MILAKSEEGCSLASSNFWPPQTFLNSQQHNSNFCSSSHGHPSHQGHWDPQWFTRWPHLSPQPPRLWPSAHAGSTSDSTSDSCPGCCLSSFCRFPFLCWSAKYFCFSGLCAVRLLSSGHTPSWGLIGCPHFSVLLNTHHPLISSSIRTFPWSSPGWTPGVPEAPPAQRVQGHLGVCPPAYPCLPVLISDQHHWSRGRW